ncbi:MAG: 30S ribosomal protein S2 [Candidatus Aenigmarchaeota archaeon]|nr:30S ribosomal protein S2 [Candidatus Aenigmarchaeota archaeon]
MGDNFLIPKEKYLEHGVHIGTSSNTKDMKRFTYKTLANGLTVLNLGILDERIRIVANFLSRYKNILVVGRKIKKPIETFANAIGANVVSGRFMPGSLTNPSFKNFFEPDVIFLSDPFIDRQALKEAKKTRIPIIALCNTFNSTSFIDFVIPCNNKGKKSLGLIFYLLAREVLKARGSIKKDEDFKLTIEDFIESK